MKINCFQFKGKFKRNSFAKQKSVSRTIKHRWKNINFNFHFYPSSNFLSMKKATKKTHKKKVQSKNIKLCLNQKFELNIKCLHCKAYVYEVLNAE